MNFLKLAALMLTLASATPVIASNWNPDHVRVPLGSEHVGSNPTSNLNEINPGLALTWDTTWVDFTAGAVKNSFEDVAPFFTFSRDVWRNDSCGVAGFLGTAHYGDRSDISPHSHNGWIPIGGVHAECGPAFVQIMPGRGLARPASGKAQADAIIVFGLTFDIEDF